LAQTSVLAEHDEGYFIWVLFYYFRQFSRCSSGWKMSVICVEVVMWKLLVFF